MYRYLICSDIHGHIDNFKYALKEATLDPLDGVIFAGDMEMKDNPMKEIVDEIAGCPLYRVEGNCDFEIPGVEEKLLFTLPDGVTCFLTHGHKHHVKSDLFTLSQIAQNLKANLVIYGHTHTFDNVTMGRTRFVNPGSLSGHGYSYPQYALMTIDNGKIDIIKRVMQ